MNESDHSRQLRVISLASHGDERGTLVAFDRDTLPFEPVRTFVISNVPPHAMRGGRTLPCDEFLYVAAGSCRLTIPDRTPAVSMVMDNQEQGVFVPAGAVVELTDFAPQTLLIVLASRPFAETERLDGRRPKG